MADDYAEDLSRAGLIDTSVAHQARIYDYWLGGKDNFAVDREAAEQALAAYPGLRRGVRAQRAFLAHVVGYLAGEAGIRQFLDIGTGIPTANNTHEVAQAIAHEEEAGARTFYDDLRARGIEHNDALRRLASRLVGVLHGCLKTHTCYDEATAWGPPGKHRPISRRSLTSKILGCLGSRSWSLPQASRADLRGSQLVTGEVAH